jgi:glycerol uptake facilitator-like aquaporin
VANFVAETIGTAILIILGDGVVAGVLLARSKAQNAGWIVIRIAHAVLPIAGKGKSDWAYSWIPVVGPLTGGAIGAVAYTALFTNALGI